VAEVRDNAQRAEYDQANADALFQMRRLWRIATARGDLELLAAVLDFMRAYRHAIDLPHRGQFPTEISQEV
jgi:hypothetical protein